MTDLTIGGETFNVLVEGDETRPVLMLSNSLGTDLRLWDGQMPALLEHFRVVRYDSRGHGGSVANPGPYSIARLGHDALAILDALEIETVAWLGISKGGAVGQWLMINAPERIERAVLANTSARFGSTAVWNQRIHTVRTKGMAALSESIIERWFGPAFREAAPARVEPVRQTLLATPAEGYASCCAALRDLDLREGIRAIDHAVLVIAGADDTSVVKAETDLLVRHIPNARLVTLATRHISNIEDEAGFTRAVIDFLTADTTRRRPARKALLTRPAPPLPPVLRRPATRRLAAARGGAPEPLARRPAAAAKTQPTGKTQPASETESRTGRTKGAPAKAAIPETPIPAKSGARANTAKTSTKTKISAKTKTSTKTPTKTSAKTSAKTPTRTAAAPKATARKSSAPIPGTAPRRGRPKASAGEATLTSARASAAQTPPPAAKPARETATSARSKMASKPALSAKPAPAASRKTAPAEAKKPIGAKPAEIFAKPAKAKPATTKPTKATTAKSAKTAIKTAIKPAKPSAAKTKAATAPTPPMPPMPTMPKRRGRPPGPRKA